MNNSQSHVFYDIFYDYSVELILKNKTSFIINLYSNKKLPLSLKLIKSTINLIVGIIAIILFVLIFTEGPIFLGALIAIGFFYWAIEVLNSRLRVKFTLPIISKNYQIPTLINGSNLTKDMIRIKKFGIINFKDKKEINEFNTKKSLIKELVFENELIYEKYNINFIGSIDYPTYITETNEVELIFNPDLFTKKFIKNNSWIREFFKIIYYNYPILFIHYNCGYLLSNKKFILSRIPILFSPDKDQEIMEFYKLVNEFDPKKTM